MTWFRDESAIEADRQTLAQAAALMSETDFDAFCTLLRTERAYETATRGKFLDYLKFLENGCQLKDRRLQEKLTELLQALRDLKVLTGSHFLAFPRNQSGDNIRFSLHPDYFVLEATDLSIDEHEFYLTAERRLGEYLARAVTSYDALHALAKKRLK